MPYGGRCCYILQDTSELKVRHVVLLCHPVWWCNEVLLLLETLIVISLRSKWSGKWHVSLSKEDVPTWSNNLLWFFLINGLYMFRTFTCPSSGVLIYRLFHCRMWCYALGAVENLKNSAHDYTPNSVGPQPQHLWHNTTCGSEQPIYKNSWRWTCKCPKHVEAIYEKKS